MLVRSGIILIKYWFSVSDEEQERRFQARIDDPTQALEAQPDGPASRASAGWSTPTPRTRCSSYTDIKQAPWYVVNADDKKRARLNCIHHLLSLIPYEDLTPEPIELPPRQRDTGYVRPPIERPDVRARSLLAGAALLWPERLPVSGRHQHRLRPSSEPPHGDDPDQRPECQRGERNPPGARVHAVHEPEDDDRDRRQQEAGRDLERERRTRRTGRRKLGDR